MRVSLLALVVPRLRLCSPLVRFFHFCPLILTVSILSPLFRHRCPINTFHTILETNLPVDRRTGLHPPTENSNPTSTRLRSALEHLPAPLVSTLVRSFVPH